MQRSRLAFASAICLVLASEAPAFSSEPPTTPQLPPPTPAHPYSEVSQDAPFRFRDMLRFEAERARTARYYNGVVFLLASTVILTAGAITLETADPKDPSVNTVRAQAYVFMGIGAVALGGSLFQMIPVSSAEQLERAYSPHAADTRIAASTRVYDGVEALRVAARKEAFTRHVVGGTTIAIGLGIAALAGWRSTLTEGTATDRTISATLTGASSIVTVGAGIAQIWFERGPAELALGHWEASQGRLHESLDRPRITPIFAPTRGGATAGVRLDL
jgi:NO-binding membrane sensor protein with MHYT domain